MHKKGESSAPYMQYIVSESLATSFHQDAHMCCLVDFAKYVVGEPHGGYFADFATAYTSQKYVIGES